MHRNIIITSIIEQKLKAQINCKKHPKAPRRLTYLKAVAFMYQITMSSAVC